MILARTKTSPKTIPGEQPFNNDPLSSAGNNNGLLKKILTGEIGYVLAILFALLFNCFAGTERIRVMRTRQAFDFSKTGMNDFHNGVCLFVALLILLIVSLRKQPALA